MGLTALAAVVEPATVHAASPGGAGSDAHLIRDDVRIAVGADGRGEVGHAMQWHVASGALRFFDLVGVEESAALPAQVFAVGQDGLSMTAHVAWFAPRVVRVTLDEPRGLHKGDYRIDLSYGVDLAASRELVTEGAMWRLVWTAPAAAEGLDGQTVLFDVPAAPTAPRADMGGASGDEGIVATVDRGASRDKLQLVRPHVARGETVTWSMRLDPRALALAHAPSAEAVRATTIADAGAASETESRWRRALEGLAVAGAAALYGWTAGRRRGHGLVALSPRARSVAAGSGFGLGLALQVAGSMTAGAIALAAGMLAASLAPARQPATMRGPASWTEIPAEVVFGAPRPSAARTHQRLGSFVAMVIAALALAGASWPTLSRPLAIASLDLLTLLPLLLGGGIAEPAYVASRRALARTFRALGKQRDLVVMAWGRLPAGRATSTGVAGDVPASHARLDEVRLRVEPRLPIPGTIGVELGLATTPGAAPRPEVLVRVLATSCASARIAALAPWAAAVPGLTTDERVVRLSPRWPSLRLARQLTARVALALVDRRDQEVDGQGAPTSEWHGPDRRVVNGRSPPARAAASTVLPRRSPGATPFVPAKVSPLDASHLLLR